MRRGCSGFAVRRCRAARGRCRCSPPWPPTDESGYRLLVEHGVALAAELADMVEEADDFELLVPPRLCIVSFRYRPEGFDEARAG